MVRRRLQDVFGGEEIVFGSFGCGINATAIEEKPV
jgi:hypothetical protein